MILVAHLINQNTPQLGVNGKLAPVATYILLHMLTYCGL